MSAGIRSGVNWMRENDSSSASASVRTSSVLPRPGTPSSSTWPPASSAEATAARDLAPARPCGGRSRPAAGRRPRGTRRPPRPPRRRMARDRAASIRSCLVRCPSARARPDQIEVATDDVAPPFGDGGRGQRVLDGRLVVREHARVAALGEAAVGRAADHLGAVRPGAVRDARLGLVAARLHVAALPERLAARLVARRRRRPRRSRLRLALGEQRRRFARAVACLRPRPRPRRRALALARRLPCRPGRRASPFAGALALPVPTPSPAGPHLGPARLALALPCRPAGRSRRGRRARSRASPTARRRASRRGRDARASAAARVPAGAATRRWRRAPPSGPDRRRASRPGTGSSGSPSRQACRRVVRDCAAGAPAGARRVRPGRAGAPSACRPGRLSRDSRRWPSLSAVALRLARRARSPTPRARRRQRARRLLRVVGRRGAQRRARPRPAVVAGVGWSAPRPRRASPPRPPAPSAPPRSAFASRAACFRRLGRLALQRGQLLQRVAVAQLARGQPAQRAVQLRRQRREPLVVQRRRVGGRAARLVALDVERGRRERRARGRGRRARGTRAARDRTGATAAAASTSAPIASAGSPLGRRGATAPPGASVRARAAASVTSARASGGLVVAQAERRQHAILAVERGVGETGAARERDAPGARERSAPTATLASSSASGRATPTVRPAGVRGRDGDGQRDDARGGSDDRPFHRHPQPHAAPDSPQQRQQRSGLGHRQIVAAPRGAPRAAAGRGRSPHSGGTVT